MAWSGLGPKIRTTSPTSATAATCIGHGLNCWACPTLLACHTYFTTLMSFSSHFSIFISVDEVTKNENRLRMMFFRLQGNTGKTKMKNNKKQTNYYVIFSFFVTFVNQNEKPKIG